LKGFTPVDALFELGSSPDASDVAAHKDTYIGEAIQADTERGDGRQRSGAPAE
jgi:hypothetical protein